MTSVTSARAVLKFARALMECIDGHLPQFWVFSFVQRVIPCTFISSATFAMLRDRMPTTDGDEYERTMQQRARRSSDEDDEDSDDDDATDDDDETSSIAVYV